MRRKEQEITDPATLESILDRATVCRLGLAVGDEPYVVPASFGLWTFAYSKLQPHRVIRA